MNLKGKDKVKNKDETAQQLADALEIDKEEVLKTFMKGVRKLKLGKLVGTYLGKEGKINDLKIPGVSFMSEKQECIRMKTLHPIYLVLLDQMIKGIRKESLGLKRV